MLDGVDGEEVNSPPGRLLRLGLGALASLVDGGDGSVDGVGRRSAGRLAARTGRLVPLQRRCIYNNISGLNSQMSSVERTNKAICCGRFSMMTMQSGFFLFCVDFNFNLNFPMTLSVWPSIGWLVGLSVIISQNDFHAPTGVFVSLLFKAIRAAR